MVNNRVNLTAGSSAALSGKVTGAVRLPVALRGSRPHPDKTALRYRVKDARNFLTELKVKP